MNEMDLNEFWDDLLAYVDERSVIPVLGSELLTVEEEGIEVPLYRAVAERILRNYGLVGVTLRPHMELNDAVCALVVQKGKKIQDLYRPISDLLNTVIGQGPSIPHELLQLASISAFDLFVTTTADDLLLYALNQVRGEGNSTAHRIIYAPNLPKSEYRDIPDPLPSNYCAVFHLFGRASPFPSYAIHEEDYLEFLYNLLTGRCSIPDRIMSKLRERNLLIIGCHLADWLNRFFIRLSHYERLLGWSQKKEFIVRNNASHDESLNIFLERFSQNSRIFPGDSRAFVNELVSRWKERHPAIPLKPSVTSPGGDEVFIDIFLSYSHNDEAAARLIHEELAEIGVRSIWFDKTALQPGDGFEQKIQAAIKRCVLFLPIISRGVFYRDEGYLFREWDTAIERSKCINPNRKFIVPIIVDKDYTGNVDQYELPREFANKHVGLAPGGHMTDELRGLVQTEIREQRRRRAA